MPDILPFFLTAAGPVALVLLFCLMQLVAAPFTGARPPVLWHLAERAGEELVRRLNRPRTPREMFFRGAFLPLIMAGFGFFIGYAATRVAEHPFGWLATLGLMLTCVSPLSPVRLLQRIAKAEGPVDRAAAAVLLRPVLRDRFEQWDAHTLTRRALETAVMQMNLFFVMPLFWFLVGGAPVMMLAVMLSAVAIAAETAADGTPDQPFVRMVRGIASVFEAVPGWLTGFLVIFAAIFVSRSWPLRAIRIAIAQTARYYPRRQGMAVAALAGALGVTLGGPRRHENGHTIAQGWIGPEGSSARISPADAQRAALIGLVIFLTITAGLALSLSGLGGFDVLQHFYNLIPKEWILKQ